MCLHAFARVTCEDGVLYRVECVSTRVVWAQAHLKLTQTSLLVRTGALLRLCSLVYPAQGSLVVVALGAL